jgi:hypothetical protein
VKRSYSQEQDLRERERTELLAACKREQTLTRRLEPERSA